MGWRYGMMVRRAKTKRVLFGRRLSWSRDSRIDPEWYDDRLSLATAVPLWGIISMIGWLILAEAAIRLAQFSAHY